MAKLTASVALQQRALRHLVAATMTVVTLNERVYCGGVE
jgi:hypothetical protein